MHDISRRDCLRLGIGATLAGAFGPRAVGQDVAKPARPVEPKSVAAIVTVYYYYNSHVDVILGKILKGWKQDGGPGPALKLASLYVDQVPASDIGRAACKQPSLRVSAQGDRANGPHRSADLSRRTNAAD